MEAVDPVGPGAGARERVMRGLGGLRGRLAVLGIVALAPAMLLSTYMAWQQYRQAIGELHDDARSVVTLAAQEQQKVMARTRQMLAMLARQPGVVRHGGTQCSALLADVVKLEESLANMARADLTGQVDCSALPLSRPFNVSGRAVFQQAIATRALAISEYEIGPISGRPIIVLGYPVVDRDGSITGVVFASVDLSQLSRIAAKAALPEGSSLLVLDRSGTVLAYYPEPERWVGKPMGDTALARHLLALQDSALFEDVGFDGVPRLYASAPWRGLSQGKEASLSVGIPKQVAYAHVSGTLHLVVAALLGVLLLVVAVGWLGGKWLVLRHTDALLAALKRLATGDLRARTGLSAYPGELGQLAMAFDEMAQALDARSREVDAQHRALDQYAMVSIADANGKIVYVNGNFVEISQFSGKELVGQTHRIVNSGHHPRAFFEAMWRTIAGGQVWHGQIKNRRKDGSCYWVESTIAPLLDVAGKPERYISILADVTQIMEIRESLRQSEARFRGMAETVACGVVIHQGGHARYVNPAVEKLMGFPREELLGMQYWELAHGEFRDQFKGRGEARLRGEPVSKTFEFRLNTKSGAVCWAELSAALIQFDGAPAVIGTFFDITARKLAEQALRHAHDELEALVAKRTDQLGMANQALEGDIERRKRAEDELRQRYEEVSKLNSQLKHTQSQLLHSEKMASIGQLAAGVAHEINNPIGYVHSNMASLDKYLRDIFGLLEAYERLEALVGERQAQEVTQLKQAVDLGFMRQDIVELMKESRDGIGRVKKIVQDLKDFSHQGSGEQWQWAHLHDCLESAHNIANSEIKYKAKVVKEYGEIPDIQCLPSQLNQVFVNLLVNAAQAIDQNGAITLRTGAANEEVWVEISDTGQGIAPENLSRIFDPFFTTKPVGTGTGLGLSLSYSIVEKHGGRIEVRSELGKGTTFRIELPARQDRIAA